MTVSFSHASFLNQNARGVLQGLLRIEHVPGVVTSKNHDFIQILCTCEVTYFTKQTDLKYYSYS
jgi:hypothetical protein